MRQIKSRCCVAAPFSSSTSAAEGKSCVTASTSHHHVIALMLTCISLGELQEGGPPAERFGNAQSWRELGSGTPSQTAALQAFGGGPSHAVSELGRASQVVPRVSTLGRPQGVAPASIEADCETECQYSETEEAGMRQPLLKQGCW